VRLLGLGAARSPRWALAIVAILGVLGSVLAAETPKRLSFGTDDFVSQSAESRRFTPLLRQALELPRFPPELAVIYPTNPKQNRPALREIRAVARFVSPEEVSEDGRTAIRFGYFRPGLSPGATAQDLDQRLERFPETLVGGPAILRQDASEGIKHDLLRAELFVLPLLLLLTLWVFRGVLAALLPVAIGWLTMTVALACLGPINDLHPISLFALNLVTGAALGLSLDYSLLLVSRFREQLAAGQGSREAAEATVKTAGRTVMYSSVTVAAAFATLFLTPIPVLQSAAIGGSLAALLAGGTALVVLPALFSLLGPRLNPSKRLRRRSSHSTSDGTSRSWYRLARFVLRHPISISAGALGVLILLAAPALGARLTGLSVTDLPVDARSQQFEQRLQNDFPFTSLNPVEIAAYGTEEQVNTGILSHLAKIPGIEFAVGSELAPKLWYYRSATKQDPFSSQSIRAVETIQDLPYERKEVTGPTADYLATAATLEGKLPPALALLVVVTLVLVFCATRSVILPPKTLLMNVLSLAAAAGLLVAVFQEGEVIGLLSFPARGPLALVVPVIVGISVFGILTDYGMFLLTRIKEGWDRGLPNREAVAVGLERTGRIVTAAALLFCVAVGALMSSRVVALREAAFGVAAAVAIDASIVRVGLVPSLMILLGRWNWWLPGRSRSRGELLRRHPQGAVEADRLAVKHRVGDDLTDHQRILLRSTEAGGEGDAGA
jgi:uncharacterized membrane protein YdfJ with MMPL/SSD domain